ncbi:MAG: metalloregulator ArsR/SmtB family transcription factor [Patescibacteria group bacterium]|mgnify:CR=1 FL=1
MPLNKTFAALSDKNRRKILDLLKEKEMAVSEIGRYLDVTTPTLSYHLDVLKQTDLVSSRREGRQIIYSLNLSVMEEIAEKIFKFLKK